MNADTHWQSVSKYILSTEDGNTEHFKIAGLLTAEWNIYIKSGI